MAQTPFLYEDPLDFYRPSRLLDQQFGLGLTHDDLLAPFTLPRYCNSLVTWPTSYFRPWRTLAAESDVGSTVQFDKDKFQANLDVQHFAPNEISVKITGDNQITIEGKHEEKQDEHGYVSRKFVRRYVLPKECDLNKVESKLSSDGVLTITAPRTDKKQIEQRKVPIKQTGKPTKAVTSKTTKAKDEKTKKK